jgi:DNA-binding CsgD family transcriptional regulator
MHAGDIKSIFPALQAIERPAQSGAARGRGKLSNREMTVLTWLALGKSAQDVAHILGISVNTVRSHIRSIIRKLNVSNIPHAVAEAFKRGIL